MVDQEQTAIRVQDVSKTFRLPHERHTSFKGVLINFLNRRGKRGFEKQHVLNDISFDIKKGEFFGIVGRNGSGKSTLLKLLAGIYTSDKGTIQVNGSLTPFIELGVGFNPELTGRENVFLNGALLGFNRKDMQAMYDDIVDFAELRRFMDQKLKNYSSGMQVRLAFSIAIRARSDILLIDEVLAVGDVAFQEKCFEVFRRMKREGRTIVFVSHDLASLQEFCDRAVLIDQGKQRNIGKIEKIIMEYQTRMAMQNIGQVETIKTDRPGSGSYRIKTVKLLNKKGSRVDSVKEGQPFIVEVTYKQNQPVGALVCGIGINDANNISLMGPNSKEAGFIISQADLIKGKSIRALFSKNVLVPGTYKVTVGLFDDSGFKPYDFYDEAATFKIIGKARHGKIIVEPIWSIF